MAVKKRRKKMLLSVTAVVSLAALGAGIWFGTRGGSEPVNVYSFQYIGMTEFWGDAQESYGPVTTDRIQTEFLSDTQTVTEVKVKDGDMVKKGDVLFAFDTTLDALSLERKRLEVEKIKVQIKAAEERLQDTREMVPYEPPKPTEPEEADLGEELKDKLYKISENTVYDGAKKETALICWLKDGTSISDAILQELYETSLKFRTENAQKQEAAKQEESSASAMPDDETQNTTLLTNTDPQPEEMFPITINYVCNGKVVETDVVQIGKNGYQLDDFPYVESKDGYTLRNAYDHSGETYWLVEALQKIDDGETREIESLTILPYPQKTSEQSEKTDEQIAWEEKWGKNIDLHYIRFVSLKGNIEEEGELKNIEEGQELTVTLGENVVFVFDSEMKDPPENTKFEFEISPSNGFLKKSYEDKVLVLTGTPDDITQKPIDYSVQITYSFKDNTKGKEWNVIKKFPFKVSVKPESKIKAGEFYVVFKTTEKNFLKGTPIIWQGAKVTVFEDGTFDMSLFDASSFADHTLPPPEDIEIDLPEINPNEMYTAEQILDMQKQCYAIIKEQNEKLKLAESEYQIMERELGDGNIYSEIDGKVVALLTEEEARERKEPLLKVSGGGGFYIEGSVSELEKEKLKIGQEVTVNDWQSGGTYTGEVVSIGDFPSDSDNWNGMGNPTASYYPFKAFVGEEADLQAGSYVSMTYSTASAEQGIYLEKPFVRTEKGNSYIYVRGADGRLEKRNVKVGKALWGSYYEILSPLGEEDFLAFPYGKNVKTGAPTVESDLSALYGF